MNNKTSYLRRKPACSLRETLHYVERKWSDCKHCSCRCTSTSAAFSRRYKI